MEYVYSAYLRPAADVETGPSEPAPRLLDRLPVGRRGTLIRLSVRDHYVDVVTAQGDTTILMRFGDDLAEHAGAAALQDHRSHWVAEDAVTRSIRRKGRVILILADGTEVPVSRSFLPEVEARFGRANGQTNGK